MEVTLSKELPFDIVALDDRSNLFIVKHTVTDLSGK